LDLKKNEVYFYKTQGKHMNIVKYETDIYKDVDFKRPTIFLAGPTVRGNQTHLTSWRIEAVKILKEKGFDGNVIIPEFSDPTESDKYRYDLPPWEFHGLRNSTVILFWIPRTRELIGLTTNYELGYWVAQNRYKVIYGRPDDAYRITYSDIMWNKDLNVRPLRDRIFLDSIIYNTLESTIEASIAKTKDNKVKVLFKNLTKKKRKSLL
jgi:nucleoside 2-deoxyribosyltransferase